MSKISVAVFKFTAQKCAVTYLSYYNTDKWRLGQHGVSEHYIFMCENVNLAR